MPMPLSPPSASPLNFSRILRYLGWLDSFIVSKGDENPNLRWAVFNTPDRVRQIKRAKASCFQEGARSYSLVKGTPGDRGTGEAFGVRRIPARSFSYFNWLGSNR